MTSARKRELKKRLNNSDSTSFRAEANRIGCDPMHVVRTAKKMGILCRKKQKAPFYKNGQVNCIKTACRWLHDNSRGLSFVLDDESYFTLTGSQPQRFYTTDKDAAPDNVKFRGVRKFEPKIMLYIAVSERGISKPFFMRSGLAVNQYTYREHCIKRRLIPFIKKHHNDNQYLFWPDKASSHYAKLVTDYLDARNINYVSKDRNPPNLPQCRPIEDIFGHLSTLVYARGWRAENCDELEKRIRKCLKKLPMQSVQKSFSSIRKKLLKVSRHGPLSVAH